MTDAPFDRRGFWEDRLGKDFSLQGVGYAALGLNYNRWLYRVRARVFSRTVRRLGLDLPSSRAFDIGSGTGFYVDIWRRLGIGEVVGSDIAQVAVDRLRERSPGQRFERVDIGEDLGPVEGEQFDAVSAIDVLFHVLDDKSYLRAFENIHSLLRPGGWLIFSDNFPHDEPIVAKHQICRTLHEIERTVRQAGFEIVSRRPLFVTMYAPVDTTDPRAKERWKKRAARLKASERRGAMLGAALYPIELVLTRFAREGPSTEIMVCRKPG